MATRTFSSLAFVLIAAAATSASAALWPGAPAPSRAGRVLVKFRPQISGTQVAAAHARLGAAIRYRSRLTGWQAVTLPPGADPQAAVQRYRLDPSVESAEYALPRRITKVPNDLLLDQWGFRNMGQRVNGSSGTPGADIHATQAWDLSVGSLSVIVAVLDTGIDLNRGDLATRLKQGYDFANNDSVPADDHGHGTAVASVIGAVGNNDHGMTGVNWKVSLMPVKVCDRFGMCDEADIVQGIDFAVANGANVINMSLSCDENLSSPLSCPGQSPGSCFSQAEIDAVAAAGAAGVTIVDAAGNCGSDNDDSTSAFPCAHDLSNNICAGATTKNDSVAFFSNVGPQTVDIGAPGEEILVFDISPLGGFILLNGTSFSSPMTAGVAALVLSRGSFVPAAVRSRIVLGGDRVNNLDSEFEGGRLNAFNALKDLFQPGVPYSGDLPGGVNLLADFNRDGKADLIRGGGGGFSISLASGKKANFIPASQWTSTLPGAVNLVGDVDADGRADVILGNSGSGFQVLRSNGAAFLPVESWSSENPGAQNVAGDFDGDGRADVMLSTGTFDVMLSTGSAAAGFGAVQTWSAASPGIFLAAADVDGDGKDDLINWTASGSTAQIDVGISNGSSFGATTRWIDAEPLDPNSALTLAGAGDFDGDGKGDLLGLDSGTGCLMVMRSTGAAFEAARPWTCPAGAATQILTGRVDRSRDPRADALIYTGVTGWQMLRSLK